MRRAVQSVDFLGTIIGGALLIMLCTGCESEQSKEAKGLLQKAIDQESLTGQESSLKLYEEIVAKYPATNSAESARLKIAEYRANREKEAGLFFKSAAAASGEEMAALYKIVVDKYGETTVAGLARGRLESYQEAKRLEQENQARIAREKQAASLLRSAENNSGSKAIALYERFLSTYPEMPQSKDEVPRRIKAEREAMRLAEAKRQKEEEERRQAQILKQQYEIAQRDAQARRWKEEQARIASEFQIQEERRLRALRERIYSCECYCCSGGLGAWRKDLVRYSISAESTSAATSEAYSIYNRPSSYCLFGPGGCPHCSCRID